MSNWAENYGLVLANEQSGSRPWLGTFDLVAFYDRALSGAEVLQNHNAGPTVGSGGNPTNNSPVALDDAFSTSEGVLLSGNVLLNNGAGVDSDVDLDVLAVSEVNGSAAAVDAEITLLSGALLTVLANGDVSYDPNGVYEDLLELSLIHI